MAANRSHRLAKSLGQPINSSAKPKANVQNVKPFISGQNQPSVAITAQIANIQKLADQHPLPAPGTVPLTHHQQIPTQGRKPVVDNKYKIYLEKQSTKAIESPYAYDAYDPLGRQRGQHKPFGQPVAGRRDKRYPNPGMSGLGQSDVGYDFGHQSERDLPRAAGRRTRAVYGTQEVGGTELPVHGPAPYQEFFTDWQTLGDQYGIPIPPDQPLPDDELNFIQNYGITFVSKLGSGGFGTVWKCQTNSDFMACKVISLSRFKKTTNTVQKSVDKLLKESLIHKDLDHQNVVKCCDIMHVHDQVSGFPFCRCLLMMELCTGDLLSLIGKHRNKRFNELEAFDMINQVTTGLKYLHELNIVHMDLKVHNIMYVHQTDNTMIYKLADFGLSIKFPAGLKPLVTGKAGTHLYMAPEQKNAPPRDRKAAKPMDVYSAGLILAECLSGIFQFRYLLNDLEKYDNKILRNWSITVHCCHVILAMTHINPLGRPTVQEVRQYHWFKDLLNSPSPQFVFPVKTKKRFGFF